MRKSLKSLSFLVLVLGFLILVGFNNPANAQGLVKPDQGESAQVGKDLPDNATFTAMPFSGAGYESRAIMVNSVMMEVVKGKGISITRVGLMNLSSKTVTGIKLEWRLSKINTTGKPGETLLKGETAELDLSQDGLLAGKSAQLHLNPGVYVKNVAAPLMQNGKLSGNYVMELAVLEATFEDETVWTAEATELKQLVKKAAYKPTTPLTINKFVANAQGCPRQQCTYDLGGKNFTCNFISADLFCTNCGKTCCSSFCGTPPCQCSGGGAF
jgi:hypothetical protein